MNPWQILGIAPTQDKKEIKKAYAQLTKMYHPEENPEEFKRIQEAFQACMHYEFESIEESEEDLVDEVQLEPLKVDRVVKEPDIAPPRIPKVETLFTTQKDVLPYQNILKAIDEQLPKEIGKKEILDLFANPSVMPYLEDESFCSQLENVLLKHKVKYVKNQNDAVFMYLSKYHMEQLRKAMDYNLVPFYQQTRFHVWLVMFVVLLLMAFFG